MSDGTLVGIDGGGSKTLVAAADSSGQVTEIARGKATSPLEGDHWGEELAEQVRAFVSCPGLLAVAVALPAYGEVEVVSAAQRQVIAELFGSVPQRLLNDVDAAHVGAFVGGAGILILSGTGSMAWARDSSGTSYRTGGWGEVVGDEGSGYWVGRRVLGIVSQSLDGRAGPTGLVEAIFNFLGLDLDGAVGGLEGWASSLTNKRTGIAPLAMRLAEAGDGAALDIISSAADELATHVHTLDRKLAALDIAWSYAGGIFDSQLMRNALIERIGREPQVPKPPPIGGALLAAAQRLGWKPDKGFITRLASSIAALPIQVQEAKSAK